MALPQLLFDFLESNFGVRMQVWGISCATLT